MGDEDLDALKAARPVRGREDPSGEAHFALQRRVIAGSQEGLFIDGRSTFFSDTPEPVPVPLDATAEAERGQDCQYLFPQGSRPFVRPQHGNLMSG